MFHDGDWNAFVWVYVKCFALKLDCFSSLKRVLLSLSTGQWLQYLIRIKSQRLKDFFIILSSSLPIFKILDQLSKLIEPTKANIILLKFSEIILIVLMFIYSATIAIRLQFFNWFDFHCEFKCRPLSIRVLPSFY